MQKATAAVQARVRECVSPTALPLANCPFSGSFSSDLQGPHMELTAMPTFSVTYDSSRHQLMVSTRSYGQVRVVGTTVDDFLGTQSSYPYDDIMSFGVSGTVSVSGGQAAVVFD